jgi:uncharacterized protein with HEPN domain
MSFDDQTERFCDILDNILRIENYTEGMDYEVFQADQRTLDAVERCLARISEAAVKLQKAGIDAEKICPDIPWADIRGIGNHLRHSYDGIEIEQIWNVVRNDLNSLKVAVKTALKKLEKPK